MVLDWVFGQKQDAVEQQQASVPDYEKAKEIAASGSAEERRDLAKTENLQPEFLYFFASDDDTDVRKAVATNNSTPLQADILLAKDEDSDVRGDLAGKIGRLMPGLSADENDRVTRMAHEVLEVLVSDQVSKVRAIIAEEIKNLDNVPKPFINLLARDVEETVAMPLLEFSPMLNDDELLAIVQEGLKGGGLSAVARREGLSADVADAVVATDDVSAVTTLLENQTAEIREPTMMQIAEKSENVKSWQAPLVNREILPSAVARRISYFVGGSLLQKLAQRNDLEAELKNEIGAKLEERLAEESQQEDTGMGDYDAAEEASARERVEKLFAEGRLRRGMILRGIRDNDTAFLRYAFSRMAGLTSQQVAAIFRDRTAKGVVALSWKAGLTMKDAVVVQKDLAKIPNSLVIHPAPDGGFPLDEGAMEWALDVIDD